MLKTVYEEVSGKDDMKNYAGLGGYYIHPSNSLYNIQSHSIITERHNVPADSPHTPWLVDKAMNENL